MLTKTYSLIFFLFLSFPFSSFSQCPDAISGIVNITSNDGTNCTFNVDVDITSNGNSSAEIWIQVDNNGVITEYDNDNVCDVTGLSGTESLNFGPYTAPCDAEITVHYRGHSSPNCGGSTCQNFFLPTLPLPIELTYFKARQVENQVLLQWETASEENNKYFEIQQSLDGINYKVLDQIHSLGNSTNQNNYKYLHTSPKNGLNYYRIKQIDFDGQFEIFNAIAIDIDIETEEKFKIYPTSVNDLLTIEFSGATERSLEIFIYNNIGSVVATRVVDPNEFTAQFNVSSFPAGLYFVVFKNNGSKSMQFFKVNN